MSALGPAAVYEHDEVARLLASILPAGVSAPTKVRNHALVLLLYRTGLRCGEALELRVADVRLDGERPTLRVRRGKTNAAARTVGLSPDVVSSLSRWLDLRAHLAGDRVFCTLRGTPLDGGYVREMLARKGRQVGIQRLHPHGLRATIAVQLTREGHPLPVVRDVLGHTSISSTDFYLKRIFPELAVDALVSRGLSGV
jgi:integrase/recombinase XerC